MYLTHSHSPHQSLDILYPAELTLFVTRRGARLLGCLGAMAATVIIAVDNVIGVIGQQFIMPGLGAELSQQSTVNSAHLCLYQQWLQYQQTVPRPARSHRSIPPLPWLVTALHSTPRRSCRPLFILLITFAITEHRCCFLPLSAASSSS